MERLAQVSRNILVQKVDNPEKKGAPDGVVLAELVLVVIDSEYQPVMGKPLIEGGQPQFGLAKKPISKTVRFLVDAGSLQMFMQTLAGVANEMMEDFSEDAHETTEPPIRMPRSDVIQMP